MKDEATSDGLNAASGARTSAPCRRQRRGRAPARSGSTTPPSSTTPAASASSRTSRASAATRSWSTPRPCSATSTIAARAGPRSTPATARASSPRCRTASSSASRARSCTRPLPDPGRFAAGLVFLPTIEQRARALQVVARSAARRAGPARRGLARGAGRSRRLRPRTHRARGAAAHRAPDRRRRARPRRRRFRAPDLPRPQARQPPAARPFDARAGQDVLRLEPLDQGHHLQGDAHREPALPVLPGPLRAGLREPPGDDPLAVLDQHLPVVGPRAAQPLHGAQRRDQHAARQHELDARAPGRGQKRPVRRRDRQGVPGGRARLLRLRDLRQRARVPAHDRAHAAALDHDDDPRGLAERSADDAREAGVLRVPLLPARALGRPGVDRVHRRPLHRRRARSQRPAPEPLLRHHRRPGDHGVGGGRAADRARARAAEGEAPARPHVPGRLRAGPHRRRRRAQGRVLRQAAVRPVAGRAEDRARRAAAPSGAAAPTRTSRCCSACRRTATRSRPWGSCCARSSRSSATRWARWATTRRWRSSPISRACSTTTSSSSSRRSPTRRSTPSAKRS